MKKILLISMALVLALGTLGLGYSMWYQTININGQVETGNVSLHIGNYFGTWGYKDLDAGTSEDPFNFIRDLGYAGSPGSPSTDPNYFGPSGTPADADATAADNVLIGYAEIDQVGTNPPTSGGYDCDTANGSFTIHGMWSNLFPASDYYQYSVNNNASAETDASWLVGFDVTNTGSIPVKLTASSITSTLPTDLTPQLIGVINAYSPTIQEVTLEGYQLDKGDTITVYVKIPVGETTEQSASGTFSLSLSAVQWNEYGEPVPTTPPS